MKDFFSKCGQMCMNLDLNAFDRIVGNRTLHKK